jgi:integrase
VEATRYLAQVETDLLRGSWADPKLGRVTFGEWVEQWRPTTANLRPGTLVLYDYLLRRFLLPAFEAVPLGRLDTMTVRAWLADLHRAGEVTPTTIAKAYRLLRRVLNVAVEAGYLPRNPCTVKGAGIERVAEMRHASIPQLHQFADAVPDRYRALILLAGYGGLRWAELVGLRRHHVDLAGARVQVVEQAAEVAGKIIVSPPKTDAGRRVVTLPRWRWRRWPHIWRSTPSRTRTGWCSSPRGAPTCSAVPSTGSCGGRRLSRSAWMGCGCTICGTRRPPWRHRPARPRRS